MYKKKVLLIASTCVLSLLYSFALVKTGMYLEALKKRHTSIRAPAIFGQGIKQ